MTARPAGPASKPDIIGGVAEDSLQYDSIAAAVARGERMFLSTLPASPRDRRVAQVALIAAFLGFAILLPFVRTDLPAIDAFIPAYQAALTICDLITAVVLFGQYSILRTPALRILASGYLFTALMILVHTLSFPGAFSPTGLLGAGPQTTAWLYMFWHGGFPLFVLGYVWSRKGEATSASMGAQAATPMSTPMSTGARAVANGADGAPRRTIMAAVGGVLVAVIAITLLTTAGQSALPAVMSGNRYSPIQTVVVGIVYVLSFVSLFALWRRRNRSVLDLWLIVASCTWIFDMSLGAVLNHARYDLGWYAGRIYGLLAASFVLMVLLLEIRALYSRLVRVIEAERQAAVGRADALEEVNRALRDTQDHLQGMNRTLADRVRERGQQLDAVQQRHRDLVDLLQEAIWIEAEGEIIFANPGAARFFGAESAEDLVGRSSAARIHPDDRHRVSAQLNRLMVAPGAVPASEMRLLTLEGKTRIAVVHAVSFLQDGRMLVMVSALDSTAQREAESQLHQAQKMESVGQLTGGIAHDFNNLLTVIIGGLDLAVEQQSADMRPLIEDSLRAADRGATLVKQMLAFSRRQVLAPEAINLSELAAGMEDLLRRSLGEEIEIDLQPLPGLWPALADKAQVENALLNLAINARDAMPSGGKLTIETGNVHLDADYAKENAEVVPGDYVMLAVTDTGTGMSPEVIDRAFEPFFTTKAVGKGSGLGLSMIYGFAKQSGGHLKIYSELDHGTTLRLYLPRQQMAAATVATTPATAAGSADQVRGGETILVVEDNPQVRDLVTLQLRGLGYQVLEAADGPSARVILDSDVVIDLLFTDVVLPGGMTGRQIAEWARQRRPGLKTLYASGYTENSIIHQGKLDPGVHFLSKPFRRHEMAAKVRETLAAPAT